MKLVVAGDLNPNGDHGVVLRSRGDVLLSPSVQVGHGSVPAGSFYVEDMPGALKGASDCPHYVVAPCRGGAREVVFCFRAADDSFELKRCVVVTSRWVRPLAVACLVVATVNVCVAGWTFEQGLGALLPPGSDHFRPWLATALTAIVGAAGFEAARVWQVVWHWKRCLVVLIASLLLVPLPGLWVARVDNATGAELELSNEPRVRVAPGSTALVPRRLAASTWADPGWRKKRFVCTDDAVTCRRAGVEAPWWLELWRSEVSFGCDLGQLAPEYRATWENGRLCEPTANFEVNVPIWAGGSLPSQPPTASLVVAPLQPSSADSALTLQQMSVSEYFELRAEGTRADLTLDLDGPHRLKATRIALGRMKDGAAVSVPALRPVGGLVPGDRTLLGRLRIGELEVGRLTCVLDGDSPITLRTVRGARNLGRLSLYRGESLFSTFEAARPELADEVVLCWPQTLCSSDRLEVSLGANWQPGSFHAHLPFGVAPERTQFIASNGRLWGTLECGVAPTGDLQALQLPVYDEVLSARLPESTKVMWSASPGASPFVSWFIRCGSVADAYGVSLLRAGAKSLVAAGTPHPEIRSLPLRACKIDRFEHEELRPADASSKKCTPIAPSFLREHPIPGCSEETSVVCQ